MRYQLMRSGEMCSVGVEVNTRRSGESERKSFHFSGGLTYLFLYFFILACPAMITIMVFGAAAPGRRTSNPPCWKIAELEG